MSNVYREYKGLNLPQVAVEVAGEWEANHVFEKSVSNREGQPAFVFYEGPPSANGRPGIHHVIGRTIKDLFCRYKTLKGYQISRKAGWDTHGLPIELGVEKELGITKKDIGTKISIEAYNQACRESVMRYTDIWKDMTTRVGYWIDLKNPYITYESKYIESVWWLLNRLWDKDLIYKGKTIQPYSPKAGTGLSSHELNMPGAYRDVKDTTIVAQFKVRDEYRDALISIAAGGTEAGVYETITPDFHFLAWTTTPWTLPSNTALAVGHKMDYVLVRSYNQYTFRPVQVILAKVLVEKVFSGKFEVAESNEAFEAYEAGAKKIPYRVMAAFKGAELVGLGYEQLLPFVQPLKESEKAFHIISGDFVTAQDGTGIVHIAPTFGADDARVAKDAGVPPLTVLDHNGEEVPLVDLDGRFVAEMGDMAGKYVKNEYYTAEEKVPERSVDVELAIRLKERNLAFKVEKYQHNYPHCWRTDKPILYYPLDSWFVQTTAVKDSLIALNKTINWKPASTGTGRFGNWLKNLTDWNLSRSRYWGIPIPIWRTEDGKEALCIGSLETLKAEAQKAVEAGFMKTNPLAGFEPGNMNRSNYDQLDLHKHFVDRIILVSESGQPMKRESDLIDVWFDSGSMPYAQWHYPFENKEQIDENISFPADFIAEGVDQTRGWFFTLHAIGTMCFDSVAFKNCISNGLVQASDGSKMSKSKNNAVDAFEMLDQYGADAMRWYMVSNAAPWENLRFNTEIVAEVRRRFFDTLYNTYQFFVTYANIDGFDFSEKEIPVGERPEMDRWIISRLNSLTQQVDEGFAAYEPTKATRAIQSFVIDDLSNWYVRLCRRRFWKGEMSTDKQAAYQTLYTCLETIAQLASPVAPFYMDRLFNDLNHVTRRHAVGSVHLSDFPEVKAAYIDIDLEERMGLAQKVTSLGFGLRKKERLKVRQPLQKLMIPVLDEKFARQMEAVGDLILSELNIKELELLTDTSGMLVKKIKPNFKVLGKKLGAKMKLVANALAAFTQEDIALFEQQKRYEINAGGETIVLLLDEVEIASDDIPGWLVASEDAITVALDITLTSGLREEGLARELVNRIQNLRKSSGFEVTDRIILEIRGHDRIDQAIKNNLNYICSETLAERLDIVSEILEEGNELVVLEEQVETIISIAKI